jgi:hypothetical protein
VVDIVSPGTFQVHTIGFEAFDPGGPRAGELPAGVRIFGSSLPSLDLEPEYITVSPDGRTAWVSLQENNAIAVLDLQTLTVVRIDALGYKDHSITGHGLDASDQDGGIRISTWANIFGMYQPDALAAFRIGGRDYVLSANEGDAREYPGLVEAARLRSTTTDASFGPARANDQAGRLNVTTFPPGAPAGQTTAYAFGARSFAVWDGATGALVFDSGDAFEQLTAAALPAHFNSNNTANNFDSRSDDKGPEPEAAAVGVVRGRTYGFIGLERIGGFAVIDLTDPTAPTIGQYVNNRNFTQSAVGPDSGPEIIQFVEAGQSPIKRPLVVVSHEITGTVSLYAPRAELTALSPARVWIGLKNSDAVGLRVDLRAEVFAGTTLIGTGALPNVATGSGGFNNARLQVIPLDLTGGTVELPAWTELALVVSVRRTCFGGGHRSGTVRLWYDGQPVDSGGGRDAGSRFDATIDGAARDFFLRSGFSLSEMAGTSRVVRHTPVDSTVACPDRPYTPFGTWRLTLP